MFKLELTSAFTNKKVFLTGSTFAVADTKDGAKVQNGMHNNGGFTVHEDYATVVGMMRKQMEPQHYSKRTRTHYRRED